METETGLASGGEGGKRREHKDLDLVKRSYTGIQTRMSGDLETDALLENLRADLPKAEKTFASQRRPWRGINLHMCAHD